ncbi:MAG: hypothetical protein KKF58_06205 [Gammaproteobacteria bacterium]|nr:hypothetical protein [Gammaproteobacteria bacterium]MBU1447885.1 hypothetical protein [Gammaproteobacteria bacterium]
MENAALLVKTDKGVAELAQRSDAVPQKLRAILIMVDGKTQWGELLNRYSGLPEFSEQLAWLVDNGYVQAVAQSGAATGNDVSHQEAFATTATGRAGLIELAHHLLGEHGHNVVQRLQETEDAYDALLQTLERCCKLIRLSIDESKAEQFRTQGIKLLA